MLYCLGEKPLSRVVSRRSIASVMFSDEHYNLPTLYMFITMIHYVLMYLVIFLSYLMSLCDMSLIVHATISCDSLMYLSFNYIRY